MSAWSILPSPQGAYYLKIQGVLKLEPCFTHPITGKRGCRRGGVAGE